MLDLATQLDETPATEALVLAPGDVVDDMSSSVRAAAAASRSCTKRDSDAGRRIALKMLLPQFSSDTAIVQRFFNEARAASAIDHPGIVAIYDFGTHTDGRAYIAMELLKGESLEHRLQRGSLSPTDGATILAQTAAALGQRTRAASCIAISSPTTCACSRCERGRDREVVDFGIAKLLRPGSPGITTSMQILGTPTAMSPVATGKPVDERSDIYGLGVLLYHCLTGRPPFAGKNLVETEELHLAAEPPRASDRKTVVPAAIDAVIRRAMAKTPTARHPTVTAFLDDLRDAVTDRQSPRRGAAVYIEVSPTTAACNDDDLDAIDRALIDAQRLLRDAGLDVLAETSNALLAGAALPW